MAVRGHNTAPEENDLGWWQFLKVKPGVTETGWVQGDLHVWPAHMGKPSFVCVNRLSHGEDRCPYCDAGKGVGRLGYLPLIRDDNKTCVVTVHEHSFEVCAKLTHWQPVQWMRRAGDNHETVNVLPLLNGKKYTTTLKDREKPAFMPPIIARYWRRPDLLPLLIRWFAVTGEVCSDGTPQRLVEISREQRAQREGKGRTTARQAIEEVTGESPDPLLPDYSIEALRKNRADPDRHKRNGSPK